MKYKHKLTIAALITLIWTAIFIAILISIFRSNNFANHRAQRHMQDNGVLVTATITDYEIITHHGRNQYNWIVTYDYNGKLIENRLVIHLNIPGNTPTIGTTREVIHYGDITIPSCRCNLSHYMRPMIRRLMLAVYFFVPTFISVLVLIIIVVAEKAKLQTEMSN